MAKGPESARAFDTDTEDPDRKFADSQLESVSKGKKDANTIMAENREFTGIYNSARKQLMSNGTVLSEEEKKAFQEKLMLANQDRDPKKLAAIEKSINETIKLTHQLTQDYFQGLDKNKELFGKDKSRNVDTLEEYKNQFREQKVDKKKEWTNKLGDEIKSLQELRNQLIKVVGDNKESKAYFDQFNKLRRHEKKDFLKELKTSVESFTKVTETLKKSGLYSDEEIKSLSVRFREAPLDQQKKMLAELEEDAKNDSIKSVQDTFKKFSPETQKKYEADLKKARGLKAKKEVIENMKKGLRETLIALWQGSKYQSPKEKSFIVSSIGKEEKPEMLEMFVKSFGEVEKTLKGFAKAYEGTPPNVQAQYDFWNAEYADKEKIAKECGEHMDKIGKWNKKLDTAMKDRLIGKESAGKYKTKFEKLTVKEKELVLGKSTLDDPRRKDVRDRFEALPKDIRDKHEHFYEMRLRDRTKLVEGIEDNMEKSEDMKEAWGDKLKKMVASHLLSPDSVGPYEEWFADLDVDEMEEAMEDSDLDNPQREKVLEVFGELPDDVRKTHEAAFHKEDLTGRIEMLKTLLPDGGAELERTLSSMEAATELTKNLQKQTKLNAYLNMANEFRDKKNQQAELEMREKVARLNPDDEANTERLEELRMLENPDSQFIGDLLSHVKDQAGMEEEIQANHLLFEIADRAHAHELHTKKQGMESRVASNDNTEFGELSGELFDYSDGEQMLDRETGKVREMQIFDENDLFRNKKVVDIREHRKRFKKDGERFTDSPARLGQYGVRDHTGKEMKGEELMQYKRRKATAFAAKILSMGTEGQITGTPSDEVVDEMMKAIDEFDDFKNAA